MKKLIVNTDGCIGCGACYGIDPEHFNSNEQNLSYVISQENLESPLVQDAIEACPVNVIALTEDCQCEDCNCNPCECSDCNCNDDTNESA